MSKTRFGRRPSSCNSLAARPTSNGERRGGVGENARRGENAKERLRGERLPSARERARGGAFSLDLAQGKEGRFANSISLLACGLPP